MASVVIDASRSSTIALTVDERESTQRRHGLVEAVVREHRGQRLAELFTPFLEQEQWDRLRRQQRGIEDQRLGGGVELGVSSRSQ
jgi:hypothetical protein